LVGNLAASCCEKSTFFFGFIQRLYSIFAVHALFEGYNEKEALSKLAVDYEQMDETRLKASISTARPWATGDCNSSSFVALYPQPF